MLFFEITVAMFAAFGFYTLLGMLKEWLLYPVRLRRKLRAAVFSDETELEGAAAYAGYLRREGKISKERLIILKKDDIIKGEISPMDFGEVYDIIKCKELTDDG